jgi:hypothetical protein
MPPFAETTAVTEAMSKPVDVGPIVVTDPEPAPEQAVERVTDEQPDPATGSVIPVEFPIEPDHEEAALLDEEAIAAVDPWRPMALTGGVPPRQSMPQKEWVRLNGAQGRC